MLINMSLWNELQVGNPLLNFTAKSGLADPAKVTTVRFVPFSHVEEDMIFVSGTILLLSTRRHKGRLKEHTA